MSANIDAYLLYEYMKKISFTVRIKIILDEPVNEDLLREAAQEAIGRYPYFSVRPVLDEGGNYVLQPNASPLPVLPEKNRRLVLGAKETNGHLFAITWRGDTVWFNFSHSPCGAIGALFWIKTTLYQYLTKKHGDIVPPSDLKTVDSPVSEEELYYPDPAELPTGEPLSRYDGGNSNVDLKNTLKFMLNPFVKNNYYYQIEIPANDFMTYAKRIDGSPNTIVTAMLLQTCSRLFKPKEGEHLSAKIAADFRNDIGCSGSYRDFVRFIHVKYDWANEQQTVEKLSMRARGAILLQSAPELSYEVFRFREEAHEQIDAQPDLKTKKDYASKHSAFRTDVRDTCAISYVGRVDWGGMADHIEGVYTITDGNLMIEVNALPDKFCLTLQVYKKRNPAVGIFCAILDEEGLPYTISNCQTRYLPDIRLPK